MWLLATVTAGRIAVKATINIVLSIASIVMDAVAVSVSMVPSNSILLLSFLIEKSATVSGFRGSGKNYYPAI